MVKNRIPIVMISDKNFIMQTEVAVMSLKLNKHISTGYDVYLILVDAVKSDAEHMLYMVSEDFQIHILEFSLEKYKGIKQVAHVPLASLVKFDICELVPEYDKILYLDGDIIVRKDLQKVYDTNLEEAYIAGVPHSLGIITGERKLNGGVLLFNAKKIRQENLQEIFIATRLSLGERKSMDQETFHMVFEDKKVFLEPKYNVMIDKVDYEKKYYSMKEYNKFYKTAYKNRNEIVKDAAIIHFTGEIKPWKYEFGRASEEWFNYYKMTNRQITLLQRKSKVDYIGEIYRKNGLRGLYWNLKDKVLGVLGERCNVFLDKNHGEWN